MTCERCASEDHSVVRTERRRTADGKEADMVDTRIQECKNCGLKTSVECRLAYIHVFDQDTMKTRKVSVQQYRDVYYKRDHTDPRQIKLAL